MTISSLGHMFSVSVTYGDGTDSNPTKQVDMHQSIKKPLYYVRFSKYLSDDAVKLAYGAVDDIEADDNIVVINRSMSALENSPEFVTGEDSFNNNMFSSFYKDVLITDVYTADIPSQPVKPLYYRHLLPGNIDSASVSILDSGFAKINPNSYRVIEHPEYNEDGTLTGDIESVGVYNNLENSFDEDSGDLTVYYLQYIDLAGTTTTILLNNEPVYKEATFADINWVTFNLKTWVKAYLINQVGNYYEFTLPQKQNYSIKYEESIRIKLEKPVINSNELPWFVRVTNGAFAYTDGSHSFIYHVPEFSNQQFNPVEPYKLILGEQVDKVGPGIVQLKHTPLAFSAMPVDIIVKDRDSSVLYALTTNILKTGTEYYSEGVATGVIWNSDKILSYDSNSGLVQLDIDLKDYYTTTASYYYTEKYYEFSLVDLNPLINPDVLENTYVIYLVPETDYTSGLESAINYLRVGRDGLIKYCSQSDISSDVVGTPYGRPINQSEAPGSATDFLRLYTLEAPPGFVGRDYPNRYLVLAELSVVRQTSVDDVVILDDRQLGGGIKDDYDALAKQKNPEVTWYGDIGLGGGMSYPGRAVVIVRLPHCLLSDYGGPFTKSQIYDVVKRHMAFGHYPVIDFYGIIPKISFKETATTGQLKVYWPSEGQDCTYNVYYSNGDRYQKHNSTPIADNSNGNTYTLDGLTSSLTYNIYVTATSANPCGINTVSTNICGGGGNVDVGLEAGDGFGLHEGPHSVVLKAKPL